MAGKTARLLQATTKNVNQKSLTSSTNTQKPALTTIRDMYQYRGGANNATQQKNSQTIKDFGARKTTINDMYKYTKRSAK